MTIERDRRYEDLQMKATLAANKLQQIVDALGDAAIARHNGRKPLIDEQKYLDAYERTLDRIFEIAGNQEKLLQEAGILPLKSETNVGRKS